MNVPASLLAPSVGELRARLGPLDRETREAADRCLAELRTVCSPAYVLLPSSLQLREDGVILDFGEVRSASLRNYLDGCGSAWLLAATLGHVTDRWLRAKAVLSPSEHLIADAVTSALAEALCDHAQATLKNVKKARFSPGYGDVSLSVQQPLLDHLDAARQLGIRLTASGLMLPSKSVTAFLGVPHEHLS